MREFMELIRPLVIVTGLLLFEAVPDVLHNEYHWQERPAKIATGVAVVILIYLLDVLFRSWSSFKLVRRARQPAQTCLEGLWLQRVNNERPYSISRIEYISDGRWSYSGIGFDDKFIPKAEWDCASIHYDEEDEEWYFAGEAWLLEFDQGTGQHKRTHRGYVRPMLENNSDRLDATLLEATVVDVRLRGENRVFDAVLHRADNLYPVRLPSVEQVKHMPATEVERLFEKKNLKIAEPARSPGAAPEQG
jgi:hypothetical protein